MASAVLEAVENNTLSIEPVGLQPVRFVKASAVECGGPKYVELTQGDNLDSFEISWLEKTAIICLPQSHLRILSLIS